MESVEWTIQRGMMFKSIQEIEVKNDRHETWERDLCDACKEFNGGCIEPCLKKAVIDAGNGIDKLDVCLGNGINSQEIINIFLNDGGKVETLYQKPTWLFCLAEYQTDRG